MIAKVKQFVNPAPVLCGWVKTREKEVILGTVVALLSLLSFGVGYLVAKEQFKQPPLIIEQQYGETSK